MREALPKVTTHGLEEASWIDATYYPAAPRASRMRLPFEISHCERPVPGGLGTTCPIMSFSLGLTPSTQKRWKTGGPHTRHGNVLTISINASGGKLQTKFGPDGPTFFTYKQICSHWKSWRLDSDKLFVHYENLEVAFRKGSDGELDAR
jgi:hypothetical protein